MTAQQSQDILRILQQDSRAAHADIATMIGTTASKVSAHIKKLEADGVILKYTTVVNDAKLADPYKIRALIEVSIRPEKKTGYDAFAKRLCKYPNVIDHYLISGNYDFLVIVEGATLQEISSFVSNKLASMDNVRSTTTHFILKKYKEHGVTFGIEEQENRLAISP